MCVCVCVCVCVCTCVVMCACLHMHIWLHLCVCVCVCVYYTDSLIYLSLCIGPVNLGCHGDGNRVGPGNRLRADDFSWGSPHIVMPPAFTTNKKTVTHLPKTKMGECQHDFCYWVLRGVQTECDRCEWSGNSTLKFNVNGAMTRDSGTGVMNGTSGTALMGRLGRLKRCK